MFPAEDLKGFVTIQANKEKMIAIPSIEEGVVEAVAVRANGTAELTYIVVTAMLPLQSKEQHADDGIWHGETTVTGVAFTRLRENIRKNSLIHREEGITDVLRQYIQRWKKIPRKRPQLKQVNNESTMEDMRDMELL